MRAFFHAQGVSLAESPFFRRTTMKQHGPRQFAHHGYSSIPTISGMSSSPIRTLLSDLAHTAARSIPTADR
jgi:hypothetical protein